MIDWAKFRVVVVPSGPQLAVCAAVALILAALNFAPVWVHLISKLSGAPTQSLGASIGDQLSSVNQHSFISQGVIVAFWVATGWAAYILALLIINAVIEWRNARVIQESFTNVPQNTLAALAGRLAISVGSLAVVFVLLKSGVPSLMNAIGHSLLASSKPAAAGLVLACLLGLTIVIYLIWSCLQIAFNASELVHSGPKQKPIPPAPTPAA